MRQRAQDERLAAARAEEEKEKVAETLLPFRCSYTFREFPLFAQA